MVEPILHIPGEPHERRPGLGYAMVALAATLFAVNGTVSKIILKSGISAQQLKQVRCAGALLALVLLATATRQVRCACPAKSYPCWSHSASAASRSFS